MTPNTPDLTDQKLGSAAEVNDVNKTKQQLINICDRLGKNNINNSVDKW